jgi:hypothetical protein
LYPEYDETRGNCIAEDAGFEKWSNAEGITGETDDSKPMGRQREDDEV